MPEVRLIEMNSSRKRRIFYLDVLNDLEGVI
jgi:hypothetical protein